MCWAWKHRDLLGGGSAAAVGRDRTARLALQGAVLLQITPNTLTQRTRQALWNTQTLFMSLQLICLKTCGFFFPSNRTKCSLILQLRTLPTQRMGEAAPSCCTLQPPHLCSPLQTGAEFPHHTFNPTTTFLCSEQRQDQACAKFKTQVRIWGRNTRARIFFCFINEVPHLTSLTDFQGCSLAADSSLLTQL